MGRMYTVTGSINGVSAAGDFIEINAPSTGSVFLHKAIITQETEFGDAQAEQLDFTIARCSVSGSGGAGATARPLSPGDTAFAGTVEIGNSTPATQSFDMHNESVPVRAGFYLTPTPEERIEIPPSGILVIELAIAPDDSIDFRYVVYLEEMG